MVRNILNLVFIFIMFFIVGAMWTDLHNYKITTDEKIRSLELELKQEISESEARCQRMTDACIYILSEGVWE